MKYQLYSCVWELTLACCFSCAHCGSKAGQPRENELTLQECLDVIDQLAELGCERVSLIGGEVFLYPGWNIVVDFLARRGMRLCIITNGYMIDQKIIRQLKDSAIRYIVVSVDGAQANHDKMRVAGSYQKAIEAIKMLKQEGFYVSVITTMNQDNAEDLEALYEVFSELKIDAWQLQNCSPMGNAVSLKAPDLATQRRIQQFVAEKMQTGSLLIGFAHNVGYFSAEERCIRGNPDEDVCFSGCNAGLSNIGIDSVGNVRGCESLYDERFIEGNIRERSLVDIWNDENNFSYNRRFQTDMLTGACSRCKWNERCAGGCRSFNYFSSGNLYESANCVIAEAETIFCAERSQTAAKP